METFFITGISTEVGKTVIAAIVTQALGADYWKPVQAGDLHYSDTDKVRELVTHSRTVFHPNAVALHRPMSPHAAAGMEGRQIRLSDIRPPSTNNDLVIEGAGGLMVPLNDRDCIIDLIAPDYKVILVSRNYLGSINHTLLSVEALRARGIRRIGIIFNGPENRSTAEVIRKMTGLPVLLHLPEEDKIDQAVIGRYAEGLEARLKKDL